MHIGVRLPVNLPARRTFIALIHRHAVNIHRLLTVQGFRQRARERLQLIELLAEEQIAMPQPAACNDRCNNVTPCACSGKSLKAISNLHLAQPHLQP